MKTKRALLETAYGYLLCNERLKARSLLRIVANEYELRIADIVAENIANSDSFAEAKLEAIVGSEAIADKPIANPRPLPLNSPPIDIFIPLSKESKFNNDELRILLRSIDKNVSGLGKVYVATHYAPDWLKDVEILDIDDTERHNKDANLLNKLLAFLEVSKTPSWCFCADDNAFTRPIDLRCVPIVWNGRGIDRFIRGDSPWQKRMVRTFRYLESIGKAVDGNFDSHCPQVFPASIKEELLKVDYKSGSPAEGYGYCIYTLLRGLQGIKRGLRQDDWKTTLENDADRIDLTKAFVGYSDDGFRNGLREALFGMFSEKSRFED